MNVLQSERSDLRLIIIPKADARKTLLLVRFVIHMRDGARSMQFWFHVANDTAANDYNCFNDETAAVVNS